MERQYFINECLKLLKQLDRQSRQEAVKYILDIVDNEILLNLYYFLKELV